MIAVDTNILVYAHRAESEWHEKAYRTVEQLAEASAPWCIPAPCIHEFLAIVTNARIFRQPTPLAVAVNQIDAWHESPSLVIIAEGDSYWAQLKESLVASQVTGAQVHDARIAALCAHHDVTELWTADRDFGRFSQLSVRNPLV